MNCYIIINAYVDVYMDDDVDAYITSLAHLLIDQNQTWASFQSIFSSISAIFSPISGIWMHHHHQFLVYFSAHYYSTYNKC
jgi:hypothetical protein